jgi:hypothetical protein
MKTTVFCGSGAALIDFGGTLTELRAGSLVTDRSAVIAPYEHLPELQHIEESSFPKSSSALRDQSGLAAERRAPDPNALTISHGSLWRTLADHLVLQLKKMAPPEGRKR